MKVRNMEVYKEWRGSMAWLGLESEISGLQKRAGCSDTSQRVKKKGGDKCGSTTTHGVNRTCRGRTARVTGSEQEYGSCLHTPTHDHNHQSNEPHNAQQIAA
jgi:hypothetical protein